MNRSLLATCVVLAVVATAVGQRPPDSPAVNDALAKLVKGRIVQAKPVEKDCMVLSYIPDWDRGDVDNIGVGNNEGGVRTLIQWPNITADDANRAGRTFLLAIFARQTTANPSPGMIQAYEIETEWLERTSWKTQPRFASKPAAKFDFAAGDGWKLFDVTALVKEQAKAKRRGHGVLLRFDNEDRAMTDFSDYKFVSREGEGEWAARRPVLLVVDSAAVPQEKKPTAAQNKNAPEAWLQIDSREGTSGPKLLLYGEGSEPQAFSPVADATIISYLADKPWGRLQILAVDMRDANRTLLRFDLPSAGKFRKAELVVMHRLSSLPLTDPFELGLHEIKEAWTENEVTWKSQPKFDDSPVLTVSVDPKPGEIRLDVTKLLPRLADKEPPRHGWLLKVANPSGDRPAISAVQPPRDPDAALKRELRAVLPWENSVAQAVEKAREQNKLVLAVVRGSWGEQHESLTEQLLLSTVLAEPDVLTLVSNRFVPVRVSYLPTSFTHKSPPQTDPLTALGTSISKCKPLALVVGDAEGKTIARLTSIGTFDRDFVLRFLVNAIANSKQPLDERDPWKLVDRGEYAPAREAFSQMGSREGAYGLSRLASLRGDYDAALRLAQPLTRGDEKFQHESKTQAGIALMRLGRFDEASALLREAAVDPAGSRAAEAGYFAGCLYFRAGQPAKAAEAWKAVVSDHASSPYALKAKARLAWPELMATYENLLALDAPTNLDSTEASWSAADEMRVVERAIDYLLAQQQPDGSWPMAKAAAQWQAAVTALVARSLHRWSGELSGARRDRAAAAARKATAWLDRQLEDSDPKAMDSFGAAYLLDYFVDLEESKAELRGNTEKAIQFLLAGQCPNGAWSYSHRFGVGWKGGFGGWPVTTQGRFHSVNTGPALVALARARDLGFAVDPAALEAGGKVLQAMRDGAGVYTYTYPEPITFRQPDASIARGPVCEEALCRLGAASKDDLKTAIDRFMEYRADLRLPVKLDESWGHPHNFSSYFYFFAYAHAASAIVFHGESSADKLRLLSSDLLRVVELDGTWVDFEMVGKPYGTAMALYVLHLARQVNDATVNRGND